LIDPSDQLMTLMSIGMGARSFPDEAQVKSCIYNDLQIYKNLQRFSIQSRICLIVYNK